MGKQRIDIAQLKQIAQRVFGVLSAKGLLIAPNVKPLPSTKLEIEDAWLVGKQLEPRVLEVLPAALLHFPRTFLGWDRIPPVLDQILQQIKAGAEHGPDVDGIRYRDMKRWADHPLPDQRVVPISERRILRSFRLKPEVAAKIRARARAAGLSDAALIETLVKAAD